MPERNRISESPSDLIRGQNTYGASNIPSSSISSKTLLRPLAPVPLLSAIFATSFNAFVVNLRSTLEALKSSMYCRVRAFRGSVRTRRRSSIVRVERVARTGRRPMNL